VEAEELTAFAASVAGVTARRWGRAADAAGADLAGLWTDGTAQGWFGLGADDALDAALAATAELGRAACPLHTAQLRPVEGCDVPGTPGGGAFEYGLRLSIMYVVGGGTTDIQRGLIARGLGLPR